MRRIAGIGLLALIGATQAAAVTARWSDIGVSGSQVVRDLWQQRDLGTFADRFSATVPAHGAMLVKVGTPQSR